MQNIAIMIPKREIEKERCERSLYHFMKSAWSVIEPATRFQEAVHLQAICKHLEAIEEGVIRKLSISIPPGFAKSRSTNVFWPAWAWIRKPHIRWLFATYAENFAKRDSILCRDLIKSEWYQSRWGEVYKIREDRDNQLQFWNNKGGFRLATSISGSGTGARAERLVEDDVLKIEDAHRVSAKEDVVRFHDQVMAGRGADPRTCAHINIQQRLAIDDLDGHLREQGGYVHLAIPMEFEADKKCVTPIWEDWRTEKGQLAWPERFGPQEVSEWKKRLGLYGSQSQLQQNPQNISGGIFKREWFTKFVSVVPIHARRVRYWDRASTKDGGCWTCGVLMAATQDGNYYVEDVIRGQWDPHERDKIILSVAHADRAKYGVIKTVFEEEGGSSGKDQTLSTTKLLHGFSVWPDRVTGNKLARAEPFAGQLGGGTVYLLEGGKFIHDYISELCAFPHSDICDQVDASSGAFNHLAPTSWIGPSSAATGSGGGGLAERNQLQPQRTGGLRLPERGGIR